MRAGLHVMANRGIDAAVKYCGDTQPAAMKWMDPDPEVLVRCRRVSPRTRHIVRTHWSDQTLARYPSFINATIDRIRTLVARPELRPDEYGPVVWGEGYNEHVTKDTSTSYIRDFAGKEVKLAEALNGAGAGALMGGCSTGFLEEVHLHAFKEVLDRCQRHPESNGFHSHEYAGPFMQYMWNTPDGRNQWQHPHGPWTGWSASREVYYQPGMWGWLTLRFVRLLPLLKANGWDKVWLAITESGTDDTPPRPGPQGNGWMDFEGEWARGPVGDFADQFHCYMWQISHHPQVRMVVDFGFGTIDPRWKQFDLSARPEMLERFKARQIELPIGHFGVALPGPVPPTQPDPRPAPVPIPRPIPAAPKPRPTDAVAVHGLFPGNEGQAMFAARVAGYSAQPPEGFDPASWYKIRLAWAKEIGAVNNCAVDANGVPIFRAGTAYKLPPTWFAVKEV